MRGIFGFGLAVFVLLGAAFLSGYDLDQAKQVVESVTGRISTTQPSRRTAPNPPPPARGSDTVRIATFNIQVFGQSKLDKPEVVDVLARVVRQFDVVAIQEIRSREQDVMPRFLSIVNGDGSRYDSVVGPRLGRTSSKEQYAYVYDATRIEVEPRSVYTIEDRSDVLHREPLVASFRVRGPPREGAFTFTLINLHTDPDELGTELEVLDDLVAHVRRRTGDDDVILLGDFNAAPARIPALNRLPNIEWVVDGQPTNTRRTECYDNLVFDRRATREFTGGGGVLDLLTAYRLTMEEGLAISDHLPVWAEFQSLESSEGPIAAGDRAPRQ